MVIDDVMDAYDSVKEQLRRNVLDVALPEEIKAFLLVPQIDKMTYMRQLDVSHVSDQVRADVKRLPPSINPMFCPGGDSLCGMDIVRGLKVSETVPEPLRKRMENAIAAWCEEMDAIAEEAGEGGVPVVVRYHLTPTGPELAFGYGREHGDHDAATATAPLAETE